MLFDSHAHINEERFDGCREELCREIGESALAYVMDIGFDLESSVRAVEDAAKYDFCYAAVGCHPHDAKTMDDAALIMLKGLAKKNKVKAIGEIGLDYYYDHSERDVQQYWFRRQIQLALQLKMPIIIHDRDANDDVMRILKEEGVFHTQRTDCFPRHPDGGPDARLLLHCFSGSRELARQYVKLGATISIAGPVTFKKSRKTVEVVEETELSRLLVETDSPYLTPEPYRGRTNKPVFVEHTARKVAEIKGISFEEAAAATCENARRFFAID
ncbi:TatD family hydrolase [Bacilliculturomica massiliensis]|nr:TatD family hydrolase [Bacilliculturomica massiliensis]